MTRFFNCLPFPVLAAALVAVQPVFAQTANDPRAETESEPVTILEAERVSGSPDREVILEGNVQVRRGDITLGAERATYDVAEDVVHITGNVWMTRPGQSYTGNELRLKIDAGQGYLLNPTYRIERNNAQGTAERIDFESRDHATVRRATYSTCEGPDPDWYLRAGTLDLDTARDVGTALGTVVYFKGVPILGSPFLTFPLSGERKSGLLPPTIGTTNKGGFELTLPYYFNIASNRDLTLYPKIIARRGLQLGAHGRYLGESYSGEIRLEGMYEDKLRLGQERWALSSTHSQRLAERVMLSSNLNAASDDDYPSDFPTSLTAARQRLLPRDLSLTYSGDDWSSLLRTTDYQVLQDPASPIDPPYSRLPQLAYNRVRQDGLGIEWSLLGDATRFWHPQKSEVDRLVLNPRVSYPILQPGYFFKPSLSLHATHYEIASPGSERTATLNRVLPTFSADAGLIFEREGGFLGKPGQQTLEPRLFYVYTPYRDQSGFPAIDRTPLGFNFMSLFSENRYAGHDLISDANQLTVALVSRNIEESGQERLRLAVAQRYYYSQRPLDAAGLPAEQRSDILFAASGQVTPTLQIDADMQYSEALNETSNSGLALHWRPAPKRVFNLQYRRDFSNRQALLEHVDISGQWPIAARWYAVGRVNYSLVEHEVAESLLGFEYAADCWVVRIVGQQLPTSTTAKTTALYFQLELTGLSKLGANPLDELRKNIAGYQLVNKP